MRSEPRRAAGRRRTRADIDLALSDSYPYLGDPMSASGVHEKADKAIKQLGAIVASLGRFATGGVERACVRGVLGSRSILHAR